MKTWANLSLNYDTYKYIFKVNNHPATHSLGKIKANKKCSNNLHSKRTQTFKIHDFLNLNIMFKLKHFFVLKLLNTVTLKSSSSK